MSSLSPKDRVSLCLFTFEDGRRCRTPRIASHPHFCFYHAKKEACAQATEKLAKDLAYFFSGDYLSACDLSTALSRLIPAVVRGDIKPKLARTVAYMFQTQLQAIHLSQREYINAFGTEGWRKALRNSVDSNHDYLFPPGPDDAESEPEPEPQQPQLAPSQHTHPQPQPQQPAQTPAQSPAQPSNSVGAGLARPAGPPRSDRASQPSPHTPSRPQQSPASTPQPPSAVRPTPAQADAALSVARSLFPHRPNSTPTQPPAPTPSPATCAPQPPAAEACHPERSEGSCLNPATPTVDETRLASAPAQSPSATEPGNPAPPPPPRPQPQRPTPTRDPYAVHYDHNYRLLVDGKPW